MLLDGCSAAAQKYLAPMGAPLLVSTAPRPGKPKTAVTAELNAPLQYLSNPLHGGWAAAVGGRRRRATLGRGARCAAVHALASGAGRIDSNGDQVAGMMVMMAQPTAPKQACARARTAMAPSPGTLVHALGHTAAHTQPAAQTASSRW